MAQKGLMKQNTHSQPPVNSLIQENLTPVTVSISYDDNHYPTNVSKMFVLFIYVWNMKEKTGISAKIKWHIIKKTQAYRCSSGNICGLCLD